MNLTEIFEAAKLEDPENSLEWQRDALCNQTDPDAFFPDWAMHAEAAITVCLECPVREKCLAYAIKNNEENGVWGGLDFTLRKIRLEVADLEKGDMDADRHKSKGTGLRTVRAREFERQTIEGGRIGLQRSLRVPLSEEIERFVSERIQVLARSEDRDSSSRVLGDEDSDF
jgi:hypothetical protein